MSFLNETDHPLLPNRNITWTEDAQERCIQHLFEVQVAKTPDATAATFETEKMTYQELNRRANQLAHYLQELGVRPEVRVAMYMKRSLELLVGLLAILKAGGAFVPLDITSPKERLASILADSQVLVVLSQDQLSGNLPEHGLHTVCLDTNGTAFSSRDGTNPVPQAKPGNIAYIIYTSGSTGQPKGVMIEHRSLSNYLCWLNQHVLSDTAHHLPAVTKPVFDACLKQLFAPLLQGGTVWLLPDEIAAQPAALLEAIKTQRNVGLNCVPSFWSELLNVMDTGQVTSPPEGLVCLYLGGEHVKKELIERSLSRFPSLQIWNLYGPTEATANACVGRILDANNISIGHPIGNTHVYLLDETLHPAHPGTPGEIYLGGICLARGYTNRPEFTAERFVPDPFSEQSGARLYKTGDMARSLPDGTLEYLGRIDQQVKIRGFRIELGEIEMVLQMHPLIKESVVAVKEDASANKRLVAYVVAQKEAAIALSELRQHAKTYLPDYMLPAFFVVLDALPLMPNGKVDRHAFPAPDWSEPQATNSFVAPSSPIEEVLAGIWSQLLGVKRVGIHDHFFELGGHSLLATQCISAIRDTLQIELPFHRFFENPTIANVARFIEEESVQIHGQQFPPIQPTPHEKALPLSFAQERIWLIQRLSPTTISYNYQTTIRFTGILDTTALEKSLGEIIRRHEIYRTSFPIENGQPVQVISPPHPFQLLLLDLQEKAASERTAEAQRLIEQEIQKPFELSQLPLIRWTLVRFHEQEHVLIHVEHHLLHDGWSFNTFLRELLQLYTAFSSGQPSPLPELSIQFADFACWQRQVITGTLAETQLAYWKQKLSDAPAMLNLPTDHPRPAIQSFRGGVIRVELPLPLCEALRTFSRREGVTLFMTMFAAFLTLLYRYSGQGDISVGTGIANRRWTETEALIGMMINTVVLRTNLSGDPSFRDLLQQVRQVTLEAYANQDLPFNKVVEALHPTRTLDGNPLFQVAFAFHDSPMPDLTLPGLSIDLRTGLGNGSSKFDLNVIVTPQSEQYVGQRAGGEPCGIAVRWEYSTDLFEGATIERMQEHFHTLLQHVVTHPEQHLSRLPLLTEEERQHVLYEWSGVNGEQAREICLHHLFETQARQRPEAIALATEHVQLTYRVLDETANQLAHLLQRWKVGPEVPVALCMERTPDLILGILAVLKAGGAFVPLDPAYPPERLVSMLQGSHTPVLLTQHYLRERLPPQEIHLLCLDTEWGTIAQQSTTPLPVHAHPENLAYIIYTSGSTGQPKGAAIEHRGAANFSLVCERREPLPTGARCSLWTSISFDASVYEIFSAFAKGGTIHIVPDEIRSESLRFFEWLQHYRIQSAYIPPFMLDDFNTWLQQDARSICLQRLLVGVEPIQEHLLVMLTRHIPGLHTINGYGPTEASIGTTLYSVGSQSRHPGNTPIGRPIQNTYIYVLDEHMQPVPIGVPGELYIGGTGLARGYIHQAAETAERFVSDPFSQIPGARLYRTGDLARYLSDGNIEFLGRTDRQMKIRGLRIEPGEIEATLLTHLSVRDAVIIGQKNAAGENRLVAYLVLQPDRTPEISELRSYMRSKLPEYMIPSLFIMLDALPLTPSGKINRHALPEPEEQHQVLEAVYEAPRNSVEEVLAILFAEILGLERVGINDHFFERGGHSLLATRLHSRIRDELQVELPLRSLFEAPTVARLSDLILRHSPQRATIEKTARVLLELAQLSDDDVEAFLQEQAARLEEEK
ncbi:MAG TPA: amino acid adenylation domain-containing protein [Ktedonobacteraceae bacterium]|nr:amino acid adenylation domain-containing protein [Ktedonobacteraceae bacterium]